MPTKQVAIIDDDASANRALGRMVRGAGFEPTGFSSAEAYLADPQRGRFACLLADIQLSGMSGIELLQELQTSGCATPVIFIAADENPAVRLEAQSLGCAGFFRKTDAGVDILEVLRAAVGPEKQFT